MTVRLHAPWFGWEITKPPSTNSLYANVPGKGRVKTNGYRLWLNRAGWELKAAGPLPHLAGEYLMDIDLPAGIDLDNIKAIPDLLQSVGIVENDRLCIDLHVRRVGAAEPCIVRVRRAAEIVEAAA